MAGNNGSQGRVSRGDGWTEAAASPRNPVSYEEMMGRLAEGVPPSDAAPTLRAGASGGAATNEPEIGPAIATAEALAAPHESALPSVVVQQTPPWGRDVATIQTRARPAFGVWSRLRRGLVLAAAGVGGLVFGALAVNDSARATLVGWAQSAGRLSPRSASGQARAPGAVQVPPAPTAEPPPAAATAPGAAWAASPAVSAPEPARTMAPRVRKGRPGKKRLAKGRRAEEGAVEPAAETGSLLERGL